ncbi:GNAT family N-acetyltransferase [Blastomonas sp.]|uniref:GNAT family N-acetyltransferase n=1 Tax=Blastomonas sp. TaxID=1909299 RepID=UPI0035948526
MGQKASARLNDQTQQAHVITCALEAGLPAALDQLGDTTDPARSFMRRAWYKADTHRVTCTLLARRRDGTPILAIPTRAIGPMVLRARAVSASYWPYRSFPMAKDASDAEIAAFLGCAIVQRNIGAALRIGPVYSNDPAVERLARVARDMGWSVLTRNLGTSFVQNIAEQVEQGIWPSKSRQRKLRSYERKLRDAHGELRVAFHSGNDWNQTVWDDLAAIEADSWVGTKTDHSGAKFINTASLQHWQTVAADPVIAGRLRATILYVADRPISFSFDLQAGDVQYGIASSYIEEMARFSPGQIVTSWLIDDAIARGIRQFDWGLGDNGYKRDLGAVAGPELVDLLFVRGPVLAAALKPRWEQTTESISLALAAGLTASLGEIGRSGAVQMDRLVLPGLAFAAAAIAMGE